MIAHHEAVVGSRFDALHHRFKRDVATGRSTATWNCRQSWADGRPSRPRPGLRQRAVLQDVERARRTR